MAGIEIDAKLAGFSNQPQEAQNPSASGGVSIDPSLFVPQQVQPQAPTGASPSGLYQGLTDPIYGISQLIAKGLENVPAGVSVMGRPVAASAKAFAEQVVPERESQYQRERQAAGDTGFDYGRLGGGIASTLVPGTAIAKGAGMVAKGMPMVQSAIAGGLSSGLFTPVESSTDFAANKAQQVLLGSVLGPAVDKTIGAVVSPAISDAAKRMRDMGVTLTPGQMFGGLTETIENALAKLPVIGSTARRAQERSMQDFNTGVIDRALSSIGDKLPKGVSGYDAIGYMAEKSGKAYDEILPKVQLGATLDLYKGLGDTLSGFSATDPKVVIYLNDFVTKKIIQPLSTGDLPGRAFKDIDTQLGQDIVAYSKQGGDGSKLADALRNVQGYLRQGLRATNPNDAPALDAANKLFADRIRIEKAAGYLGADAGVFTPQQLLSATKATDSTARANAFSRGQANMQDVARDAVSTMGRTGAVTPNQLGQTVELGAAGTALAALSQGALPLTAGLSLAPLPFYTAPVQNAFNALMGSARPAGAQTVRQMLPAATAPQFTGGLLRDPEGRFIVPISGVGQRQ